MASSKREFCIERLAGLQDGVSEMDELTHGGADDGFPVLAVGFQAFTEGPDDGVVLSGGERGHIERFA